MWEADISKMNYKELRNEVQLLRDELAIFKRKYEDAIYNLDSDNLGKSFTIEQGKMKAQIQVTADAIKTMVSKTDLATSLEKYSTIAQTADAIQSVVSKGANLDEAITIGSLAEATDIEKIYKIENVNTVVDDLGNARDVVIGETYYYYNNLTKTWEVLSGENIYTMFTQTAEGFVLKGNTIIDGTTTITRNLVLSGNVTWDMENSPVQTQYSADNASWHSPMASGDMYMRMSFDGGKTWSTSTKVVGTDGKNGTNGSNASVTPQAVFNALTDSGANQGIFAAFVENDEQIYINAEFVQAGILSGMTLQNTAGTHKLQMSSSSGSDYGTFRLYNANYGSVPYFSIYDSTLGKVNLLAAGLTFLETSVSGSVITVTPQGTWDFSSADVAGITAVWA